MKKITFPLGSYQTNCSLVWGDSADTCVIIDPGFEPDTVLELAQKQGKKIDAILLTHGHFDHVGAVKDIVAETGCRVYICEKELSMPEQLTSGKLYYTNTYQEGDLVQEAGLTFKVLHTPGHTPGSVCLICEDTIFAGDTLFQGSCGRTDLPGGSWEEMCTSLTRLYRLSGDYEVISGHGPDTTLEAERMYNPYIK